MANSDLINCSSSSSKTSKLSTCSPVKTTRHNNQSSSVCHNNSEYNQTNNSRSRQRWQLLSKAVRLKQFNLEELMQQQSIKSETSSLLSESPSSPLFTSATNDDCYSSSSSSPRLSCAAERSSSLHNPVRKVQ